MRSWAWAWQCAVSKELLKAFRGKPWAVHCDNSERPQMARAKEDKQTSQACSPLNIWQGSFLSMAWLILVAYSLSAFKRQLEALGWLLRRARVATRGFATKKPVPIRRHKQITLQQWFRSNPHQSWFSISHLEGHFTVWSQSPSSHLDAAFKCMPAVLCSALLKELHKIFHSRRQLEVAASVLVNDRYSIQSRHPALGIGELLLG